MNSRTLVFVGAVLLGLAASAQAQAQTSNVCTVSPCPVQTNKPFVAAADHDGVDTADYRLYVNGSIALTLPVSSLANGVIQFAVTLPRGTFVLYIEAVGEGGASAGASLTVVSTPGKPKTPANFRIITSTGQ